MRVLELFAGTRSIGKAFEKRGHKVFSVEWDKNFKDIDLYKDINELTAAEVLEKFGHPDVIWMSPDCFPAGTLIWTRSGYKPVEQINCFDEVLTHNNRYKRVYRTQKTNKYDMYNVKISGCEPILVSSEHPYYVRKKTYINTHKDGRVVTYTQLSDPEWIKVRDLTTDYKVGIPINTESIVPEWNGCEYETRNGYGRTSSYIQNDLSKYMNNQDFWWLVGRYFGDGSLSLRKCTVDICCAKNEINEIKPVLDKLGFKYSMYEKYTANHFCGQHIIPTKSINEYEIDEELAYILGRYVADGHIRKTKRKGRIDSYQYQVILSIGSSKIEKFKKKVTRRHYSCYEHSQSVFRCVFSSMELLDFITTSGFGTSAHEKNIPEFIYNLPENIRASFLEGYMDGDGAYVQLYDEYVASTVSPRLAFGLQRLITSVHKTNVSVRLDKSIRGHKIGDREIRSNYPLYSVLYKKGVRKQSVAHIQDDICWTQVKSVTPTERVETVYNIEVEGDNSYTVNNCIVHNCTYWSIAQKNNRETEASGMGWDLFSQYVRALHEANPKYFIYENNKSMSAAIRKSITDTFGFDAICINSALVSAQNRQRLYWVGKRNSDGIYSKVDVQQPEDRGILLKDILDGVTDRGNMALEPLNITPDDKSETIKAQYHKTSIANICKYTSTYGATGVAEPVSTTADGKAFCLTARYYKGFGNNPGKPLEKHRDSMVAEPVCMRYERSDKAKELRKDYESGKIKHGFHEFSELHPRQDGKTNTVSTVLKDNPICEPVVGTAQRGRYNENGQVEQTFEVREDSKSNCVTTVNKDCMVAVGVDSPKQVGSLPRPNGELSVSQAFRIYDVEGKSVTINANGGGAGGKTGLYTIDIECHGYAQPCEWDENGIPTKAISGADGKKHTVYEVRDGLITIKEKTYPIKLNDGYYIIRKLTVTECKRLQQVPEWYEFPVSDSQAYRMLGNGWSVEVIAHLIKATVGDS